MKKESLAKLNEKWMLNMSESAKVIDVVLDGTGGRARTLVNRPGTVTVTVTVLLIGR